MLIRYTVVFGLGLLRIISASSVKIYERTTEKPTYHDFVEKHESQVAALAESKFRNASSDTENVHGVLLELFYRSTDSQKLPLGATVSYTLDWQRSLAQRLLAFRT